MKYLKKFKQLNESVESETTLLDKEEGLNALIEGFILLLGEHYREFITKVGGELFDIGYQNGQKWSDEMIEFIFNDTFKTIYFVNKKHPSERTNDEVQNIIKDLSNFTSDPLELLERDYKYREPSKHKYIATIEGYVSEIENKIDDKDVKTRVRATPFDYFKNFKVSTEKRFKSLSLFGESGLGLDEYNPSALAYMKSENELFYPIENIARKFHLFGMYLSSQDKCLELVDKLTNIELISFMSERSIIKIFDKLTTKPISEMLSKKLNLKDPLRD